MSVFPSSGGTRVEGSSFRDPSGFVFYEQGRIFRQVNSSYADSYEQLVSSGLYDALVGDDLLIPHREIASNGELPLGAYRILEPEPVRFISYPYEWCFSQLKAAALATLEIQRRALDFGMSLKDASAYNIQFRAGRPILIDTLSFEPYQKGRPWVAYGQFCRHFLAPLALMAHTDVRLGQLLRVNIDGIPLDLASRLLPKKTRLYPALLFHVHLHAAAQRRYADSAVEGRRSSMTQIALRGLVDSLRGAVERMRWQPTGTVWADYYTGTNYDDVAFRHKQELVTEFLGAIDPAPARLWDLGANTGVFSRLASRRGIETIAADVDPAAVERNYLACIADGETTLLPLLIDLTNPSPGIGWEGRERQAFLERGPVDAILALALIHHLAISNNVPLGRLAEFFASRSRWLVIEFVPKIDAQVVRLLRSREDVFPTYTREGFEEAFARRFMIRRAIQIEHTQRTLYLMETRPVDRTGQ